MMETGTFLNEKVQDYIKQHFIPLKYGSGSDAGQFLRLNVKATPMYIILDPGGNELHRVPGFFRPDAFIAQLETARTASAGDK
ncbi:MAG TPA: hypothetical protein ENG95_03245 [Nitrospirae bacterium]|nr:hypothetical protein BMS3Abin10_00731 [bacterium BMS3Abin10]GBE38865.1 hypothetical protein BMS3Bbin08_01478 [bacterium BMS3Bbin08]HDH50075.1 hypothetical protein [Nitrospirota bacterium]HDK16712.1 hypothetical protein [Nitrospirota bacterium]HDK81199.1 hypothetical protein [Nitrospirota bacterium]